MPGPVKEWSPVRGSWFVARGSWLVARGSWWGEASRRAVAANWDNGRPARCMGRMWTVHGTGGTPVLPVSPPPALPQECKCG